METMLFLWVSAKGSKYMEMGTAAHQWPADFRRAGFTNICVYTGFTRWQKSWATALWEVWGGKPAIMEREEHTSRFGSFVTFLNQYMIHVELLSSKPKGFFLDKLGSLGSLREIMTSPMTSQLQSCLVFWSQQTNTIPEWLSCTDQGDGLRWFFSPPPDVTTCFYGESVLSLT